MAEGNEESKQVNSAWWNEARANVKSTILPLATDPSLPAPHYPFYCVHSISGAGGAEFGHLAQALSPDVPFFAFQVPTAERTKENGSSLTTMATRYCHELLEFHRAHYGDTPFYLGGWSAGVMVTYEMAQQLRMHGAAPELLIAIDKCPRNQPAEIGVWNSNLRNILLWLKRSWRNRTSTWGAVQSLTTKLVMVARHQQIYGGPDTVYDSQAVINRMAKDARSPEEAAFIAAFYAEIVGYVPLPYTGKVLALVTEDGYRDRVVEGWKYCAPHAKVVRIAGTHASVVRGRLNPTDKTVDLGDVILLAAVLRRELTNLSSVPLRAHFLSAAQTLLSPGRLTGT